MERNEHDQGGRATINLDALLRSEWFAVLLLVPRVTLGWISLQLGWSVLHLTPLLPIEAGQLLALGLTLSGIALVLGLMAGPAAFISGTLSAGAWEQGDAATASVMFALAVLLVLTWRSAGQIGLDRWLLPSLGLAGPRGSLVAIEGARRRRDG
jgi:hypothetical protein